MNGRARFSGLVAVYGHAYEYEYEYATRGRGRSFVLRDSRD